MQEKTKPGYERIDMNEAFEPSVLLEVPINLTNGFILDAFMGFARENKMNAWKLEKNKIVAVSKRKSQFLRCFRTILSVFYKNQAVFNEIQSVIQLKIAINKTKFNKRLIFSSHRGDVGAFEGLARKFHQELLNPIKKLEGNRFEMIEEDHDSDLVCENCVIEANSTYIFHKILISSSYDIGQKVLRFVSEFEDICLRERLEDSLFYLTTINNCVEEVVENIYSDYNYGKTKTRHIMPFCRLITEKFLLTRLHTRLTQVYYRLNKAAIDRFLINQGRFLSDPRNFNSLAGKYAISGFVLGSSENMRDYTEILSNLSPILRDSIQSLQTVSQSKDIHRNLQTVLLLCGRLRLGLLEFRKDKELDVPLYVVFYFVLVFCKCEKLLEQLFLMGDYLGIKEAREEIILYDSVKVIYSKGIN